MACGGPAGQKWPPLLVAGIVDRHRRVHRRTREMIASPRLRGEAERPGDRAFFQQTADSVVFSFFKKDPKDSASPKGGGSARAAKPVGRPLAAPVNRNAAATRPKAATTT